MVVGRLDGGALTVLLDAAALDACGGDVDAVAAALDDAMTGGGATP